MVDITVDARPAAGLPYDPDTIPDAVKRRAAAVDALYTQAPVSNGSEPVSPTPAPGQAELPLGTTEARAPQPPVAELPTTSAPAAAEQRPAQAPEPDNPELWKSRYYGLQGRYNSAQKTIGEMQEQMTQMGNELLQTQRPAPQQQHSQAPPAPTFLTDEDVQNYGTDLVDFAQRAAAQALAPTLAQMEAQNVELQRRLAVEARRSMDARVEQAVPNYREIDRNPRWHTWLRGVDTLSGRVRQGLLNEAIAEANATRAISFFKGFLQEEVATGHVVPPPSSRQAPQPHRDPAVDLVQLAAPGRARSATGGDPSVPNDKPIYTRAQIAQLYAQHRKGAYVGREAEWARQEADFYTAQREGRVH